ncbi:MAG TPA: hypothetical protein VM511_07625, partial [Luteolibacter sp.]|nr:hypothetical protein [Luteolibacter sp.]
MKTPPACRPGVLPLVAAISGLMSVSSQAILLVQESFSGYNNAANLGGQAGLGTGFTGNWESISNATYDALHRTGASGLTFNGIASSGGALPFASAQTRLTGVALNLSSVPSAGSTLYSSYLVNLTTLGGADSGVGIRISSVSATSTTVHGGTFADSRANDTVGIAYDGTFNPAVTATGTTPLATGQTYLIVSSYTNINNGATSGTATLYAFNQAQYASFLGSGNTFADYVAAASIGQGANQIWGSSSQTAAFDNTMDNSDYFQILTRTTTGTIDEIRYGTSFADVLPIPEPSLALLSVTGLI